MASASETKWTPGPYEYRGDRTIAAAGVPLARCYADRNAENNGPLFAAAPEMVSRLLVERANRDQILVLLLDGHVDMVIEKLRNGSAATDDLLAKIGAGQ